jgi:hypothetical protein
MIETPRRTENGVSKDAAQLRYVLGTGEARGALCLHCSSVSEHNTLESQNVSSNGQNLFQKNLSRRARGQMAG